MFHLFSRALESKQYLFSFANEWWPNSSPILARISLAYYMCTVSRFTWVCFWSMLCAGICVVSIPIGTAVRSDTSEATFTTARVVLEPFSKNTKSCSRRSDKGVSKTRKSGLALWYRSASWHFVAGAHGSIPRGVSVLQVPVLMEYTYDIVLSIP